MKLCMKHPHSSNESAAKCYAQNISKRADKILRGLMSHPVKRYKSVKYAPPLKKPIVSGGEILYFYGAERESY